MGTVIGPMFGRMGAIAVCDECYSHTRVDDLTIPILSLSSIDDPITTRHGKEQFQYCILLPLLGYEALVCMALYACITYKTSIINISV